MQTVLAEPEQQQRKTINAADRLIVALDLPTVEQNEALVEKLNGAVSFFKIGLRLHLAPGLEKNSLIV